jgi:uncharacterized LabA/DUF88 family protein
MKNTVVLFDGFNLYHALIEKYRGQRPFEKYKWLDYRALAQELLSPSETLSKVYLFTTYPISGMYAWKSKKARHMALLEVQRDRGIRVVMGRFARRERRCLVPRKNRGCRKSFTKHEEKRTDVNIAVALVALAYENAFDNALLVSADSDLIPAVKAAKKAQPSGRIVNVAPIGRGHQAQILANECHAKLLMREKHLKAALLPREVQLRSGKIVTCPTPWNHA